MVLIGPPGAGKSSVGRRLAELLGTTLVDTDELVEQAAGISVAEIFIEHGEARFRALEAEAVVAGLGTDGVLALGGGAVLDPVSRARLTGHRVVLLDLGVEAAARRVGLNQARPLLLGNPRAQWVKLMAARRPVYAEVATDRVVTDELSVEQAAEAVLALLAAPPAGRAVGGPG